MPPSTSTPHPPPLQKSECSGNTPGGKSALQAQTLVTQALKPPGHKDRRK